MDELIKADFDIRYTNHADAILERDFPSVLSELEQALLHLQIPVDDLIGSGGGEAKSTKELGQALHDLQWAKKNISVEVNVGGFARQSQSHEVDHFKSFPQGDVLLEIEWNNKDPFFDRDLANFKSLHGHGGASVGIIITRGASLQDGLHDAFVSRLRGAGVLRLEDMAQFGEEVRKGGKKAMTARKLLSVKSRVSKGASVAEAVASMLVSDKFGASTTHWAKLMDRIDRGVGSPCPLLLIGLPLGVVTGAC